MKLRVIALAILLFIVVFIAAYIASTSAGYLDVSDLKKSREGTVNVIGVIHSYEIKDNTVKVVLEGRDNSKVTLKIDITLFTAAHGKPPGQWIIGKTIGIRGYYKPSYTDENLGIIEVNEILSPCKDSYKSPHAKTTS